MDKKQHSKKASINPGSAALIKKVKAQFPNVKRLSEVNDPAILREILFYSQEVRQQEYPKELPALKQKEHEIFDKISTLLGPDRDAVTFCGGVDVSDNESDDEQKHLKRTKYRRLQQLQKKLTETKERATNNTNHLAQLQEEKTHQTALIESLKQQLQQAEKAYVGLNQDATSAEAEQKLLKSAFGILQFKESKQKNKMIDQKEKLSQEISKTDTKLKQLQTELSSLMIPEDIAAKKVEISNAQTTLRHLHAVLSQHTKDMATAKGKAGTVLTRALWWSGLYNYEEQLAEDPPVQAAAASEDFDNLVKPNIGSQMTAQQKPKVKKAQDEEKELSL